MAIALTAANGSMDVTQVGWTVLSLQDASPVPHEQDGSPSRQDTEARMKGKELPWKSYRSTLRLLKQLGITRREMALRTREQRILRELSRRN